MWMCDNGEMIYEWYVNDGEEDCMDGSDEDAFFLAGGTSKTGTQVRNITASTVVSTPLPLDLKPHLPSCVITMVNIKI